MLILKWKTSSIEKGNQEPLQRWKEGQKGLTLFASCLSKMEGKEPLQQKKIPTALAGKAGELRKSNRATETSGKHKRLSRRASEPVRHTLDVSQSRFRIHSAPPYLPVDRDTLLTDRRFTNAARNLSDEELAELYEDILKPLDFYAMLHERRKQS